MGRDAMHTGNQTYQSGFAMRSICSLIIAPRLVSPLAKSVGTAAAIVCEVHDVRLKVDIVGLGYGLVLPCPAFERAKDNLFPHSNRYVMGGCVVQPENAAEVLYCPKCRQAEARWLKAHPMQE